MISTRRKLLGTVGLTTLLAPRLSPSASAKSATLIDAVHGLPASMYQAVTSRFNADDDAVHVSLETPFQTYEDLTGRIFRGKISGDLPDVAFQGLNRIQGLVQQNTVEPLKAFVQSDDEWARLGYDPAMLNLGKVGSENYGLPFAISTPILFYNADLVRQAGWDPNKFPDNWEEIVSLAKAIKLLGSDKLGVHFEYFNVSGNWTFIALVQSYGGTMATSDDKDVAFGGQAGLSSLELLYRIGEVMVDMSLNQASQVFSAGSLGIIVTSSASTVQFER